MTHEPTLEYARRRDEADPLRSFRDRFAHPRDAHGNQTLFLCGHSLGLMPLAARELINEELDDWSRLAVLGHEHARRPWIPYHENLTAGLMHLTGAKASEVIAMNSLTVNLHLMLASFFRPTGKRTKILIETGAFSSDRHAVTSQLAWHGLDAATHLIELTAPAGSDVIPEESIEACLDQHGAEIALVLWPGVQFRTGQAFDLDRIARAARRAGCVMGFDLAHAVGNMPLALHDLDADFAVWCSYKYLNAGPGAIGGCFVHERHHSNVRPVNLTNAANSAHRAYPAIPPNAADPAHPANLPIPANPALQAYPATPPNAANPALQVYPATPSNAANPAHAGSPATPGASAVAGNPTQREHLLGWWGHEEATRFRMESQFRAGAGITAWQISNPPILATAPLIASLALFQEARIERLRAKSIELTGFLEVLIERLGPDARFITPREVAARGCQISVRITGSPKRGRRVFEQLGERGVVCDWRDPDVIRVAPVPLYNTFEEAFRFSEQLAQVLREIA